MPNENTHIYFAHELSEQIVGNLSKIIKENIDYFYLGSVASDVFYYDHKPKIRNVFYLMHGNQGKYSTNKIIFELIENLQSGKINSEKDLVFIFGIITHCALDSTLHPAINSLSGDYYDKDSEVRRRVLYTHSYLETLLDTIINEKYYFDILKYTKLKDLSSLKVIAKRFDIKEEEVIDVYKKRSDIEAKLHSKTAYTLISFLQKFGMFKTLSRGFFYPNLNKDRIVFPEMINYKDPNSGEECSNSIEELFTKASKFAIKMIIAANNYYNQRITKEEALEVIDGRDFGTGRLINSK